MSYSKRSKEALEAELLALLEQESAYQASIEQAEFERAAAEASQSDPHAGLVEYRLRTADYIRDKFGWEPWAGTHGEPGQVEIIEAYNFAIRQQLERRDFEAGLIAEKDLTCYVPDAPVRNFIRVEAGHTVGKTKLASGLVNHFFDVFEPAILYTFAPSWEQIHDLLWKEIKADRRPRVEAGELPGRVLDLALVRSDEHFAKGRATNNAGGQGTERAQGQHGPHLMFVLDEAEGIPQFVYSAVESMASGGIVIVLMLANPRTRSSPFYHMRSDRRVANFRLSCIYHPNVVAGREIVPGAVRRDYVLAMVDKHCEPVMSHSEDDHTFELPWARGTIYKPNAEFMFRVLGIPPKNLAINTLITLGRYEAATKRHPLDEDPTVARIGIDVARWGDDIGTGYLRHAGTVRRFARWAHQDTVQYVGDTKALLRQLKDQGVTRVQVRVDGGGGYGGNVVDGLRADVDLMEWFEDFPVFEVLFNATAQDETSFADFVTEMYWQAAETLLGVRLESPPPELEGDLTERQFKYVNKQGRNVKKLEDKDAFKKRMKELGKPRSPDDGDGFVLCVAPDFLFANPAPVAEAQPVNLAPIIQQPRPGGLGFPAPGAGGGFNPFLGR